MTATELLLAYQRAHDARDLRALAALFGEEGELVIHGSPLRAARGAAAVEQLLAQSPSEEALVLGPIAPWLEQGAGATYGWRSNPSHIAGELLLVPAGDRIQSLEIHPLASGPVLPRERVSIRAVVLAPGPRVLLFECHEPGKPGSWWITPGGGREPEEDDLATLRRELREEVGIELKAMGPCLWTRTHTFVWQESVLRQHERFYLVQLEQPVEPVASATDAGTLGHRWWSLDELRKTEALLAPRQLARLLAELLRDGPPPSPIDAGL